MKSLKKWLKRLPDSRQKVFLEVIKADDVRAMLKAGADKVAVNSAAIFNPDLINELCWIWFRL